MRYLTPFFFSSVFCAFAIFSPLSQAENQSRERNYRVRIVCADDINCGKAVRLFKRAAKYVRSAVQVNLQIVDISRTKEVVSEGDYLERLFTWAGILGKKEDLTFVVLDAYPKAHYMDFPNEEVLGIAESIGGLGERPVIAMCKMMGADDFTVKTMIHELGHLMGATHIPLGLMAPSAQQNQYTEAYAIETIRQIREYFSTLP